MRWIRKIVETRRHTPFFRWDADLNPASFTIRIGDFALVAWPRYYSAWGRVWYFNRRSWCHGQAGLGRIKIIW